MNFKPVEKADYSKENSESKMPENNPQQPNVSSSFAESLPMFASFVNMYGKSFANAKKNYAK